MTTLEAYREAKVCNPGLVILCRDSELPSDDGREDMFSTFEEDALLLHNLLGRVLLYRDGVPVSGFPEHALETVIRDLLRAGHRVAVCEQVSAGQVVKRVVTDSKLIETSRTMFQPIVICEDCNAQFDTSYRNCPHCNTRNPDFVETEETRKRESLADMVNTLWERHAIADILRALAQRSREEAGIARGEDKDDPPESRNHRALKWCATAEAVEALADDLGE